MRSNPTPAVAARMIATRAAKKMISSKDGPLHASTFNLPSHNGSIRSIADGFAALSRPCEDITLIESIVFSGDISEVLCLLQFKHWRSSSPTLPLVKVRPGYTCLEPEGRRSQRRKVGAIGQTLKGMVQANVGQRVTSSLLCAPFFVPFFTYNELMTSRDHNTKNTND